MGRGNKPMRVAPEFFNAVKNLTESMNKTSAEVTKEIARKMKTIK